MLQDDVHIANLTVEETLCYAAMVKLPSTSSVADRAERVDYLLTMMGLKHVKDTPVGDASIKGISGGQKRRLSLAVSIMSLPRIIFLDGMLFCRTNCCSIAE